MVTSKLAVGVGRAEPLPPETLGSEGTLGVGRGTTGRGGVGSDTEGRPGGGAAGRPAGATGRPAAGVGRPGTPGFMVSTETPGGVGKGCKEEGRRRKKTPTPHL